jgi:hypothetical protein
MVRSREGKVGVKREYRVISDYSATVTRATINMDDWFIPKVMQHVSTGTTVLFSCIDNHLNVSNYT